MAGRMPVSSITISDLRLVQIPELARLFSAALESDFSYIAPEVRQRIRAQNSALHLFIAWLKPRRHVSVAVQNGRIIGYVIAGSERDGSGNIDWLYVRSDIRGANIGLKLLSRAMKRLNQQGARFITLETYAYTAYYKRQGFRVVRRLVTNGIEQDLMRYDF